MSGIAEWKRRLRLGPLWLRLWHQPTGRIRHSLSQGGPWAQRTTERHRRRMEEAAAGLPPLPARPGAATATVHVLSGRRFWYQTAFCLHSMARQSPAALRAEIYDDGSLDDETRTRLARLGPNLSFHPRSEIFARLDAHLPEARFPALRERWRNYPNLRKLTDPHLGSAGWKLVIDSDLLFFRRPDLLLNWLAAPDRPLHAVDCEESYGYPAAQLARLAGAPLGDRVNVGLCGLKSDALDWERLERWCVELAVRQKPSYYLEQALVAMLDAGRPCAVAPAADYVTGPGRSEVEHPRAVMHHYVAGAKRWYFRFGWRRTLA